MLKTIGLLAAVALLASPGAFGQNADTQNPAQNPAVQNPAAQSPAPATPGTATDVPSQASQPSAMPESGTSSAAEKPMGMRERHHRHMRGASTDNSANRLNACMASANPTPEQEECLRQASNGTAAQPQ